MTSFPNIIAALLLATIFALQTQAEVSIQTGDIVQNKDKTYAIGTELGHGKFGKVFNAVDKDYKIVALKVTSTEDKFTKKTAKQEIRILKRMKRSSSKNPGRNYCVEIKDDFVYNDQICMVLPKLGTSIGSFFKHNNWQPFRMSEIKLIAWQLVNALAFLHELGITHGDVKTDNILFRDDSFNTMTVYNLHDSSVKLIDFGLSATTNDRRIRDTNLRQNRSPEMLMGWGWMEPSDVWALGCVLFELYTGGHRLYKMDHFVTGVLPEILAMQHLLEIETVMRSRSKPNEPVFPDEMRLRASKDSFTKDFFNSQGGVNYDKSNINDFDEIYKPLDEYKVLRNDKDTDQFFSLLRKMLAVDPKMRIKMRDALKHKFFRHIRHHRR